MRHSLSPTLHNAWFAHHGIDGVYVALEAPLGEPDIAAAIRTLGLVGVNLTVPHKATVLPSLDRLDDTAVAVGAVNTVVHVDGSLVGYNTDVHGINAAIEELGVDLAGTRCAVLGAGGAGRAAAFAAVQRGASVCLFNRNRDRAERAAERLGPGVGVRPLTKAAFAAEGHSFDLVINATSGAARDAIQALPTEGLSPRATWIDLNYWDARPPHLAGLRGEGHRTQTGHAMLLHQAARAFELFTGTSPDVDVGRRVLLDAAR